MSPKIEPHSKLNVAQNGISFKMEYHLKWSVPQIAMPLLNRMPLKMEFYSKLNGTQN